MVGYSQAPAALPPGMNPYTLHGRLGGPQSRFGQVRKISLPPGFDPRAVQPIASRYTDSHCISVVSQHFFFAFFAVILTDVRPGVSHYGRTQIEGGQEQGAEEKTQNYER